MPSWFEENGIDPNDIDGTIARLKEQEAQGLGPAPAGTMGGEQRVDGGGLIPSDWERIAQEQGIGSNAPAMDGGAQQPAPSGSKDYRSQLQDVLSKTQYGYKGLEGAEKELGQGWEFQRDSSGMLRGRLKDPSGFMYDVGDPSEGAAGRNWVSGGTQGAYHITDRGQQPDDVWSMGGGAPAGQRVQLPASGGGSFGGGVSAGGFGGGGWSGGNLGSIGHTPLTAAQDYTPQTVTGPAPLTLGSIAQPDAVRADQVGPGERVTAGTVQPGERVSAQTVTGQRVGDPERIVGPEALSARTVADPSGYRDLTAADYELDPYNQVQTKAGLQAIQQSAAARGLLHSGGTLKGLSDYGQQQALAGFKDANERRRQTYQQNLGNTQSVTGQNNAAQAQAYGLTNQYQQSAALANQQATQQAGMFNAGNAQQAALANQQANLNAGQFNSAQQQQANLANVGNRMQADQFTSAQGQQAALANQGANLQAGQFNAGMRFNTQQQNIGNQLAAYQAYQPLAQQNAQFNAAQHATAAQNNFSNRYAVEQGNNANALAAFGANTQASLGQGNLALGNRQADQSFALGQGNLALGNRQADQSYSLGLGNLGVAQGYLGQAGQAQSFNQGLQTFNTNYGVYRDNRDTAFNQAYSLANLGYGAASQYGNAAGNLYTNQGNANAAAGLAGANAWSGALGNIGNAAQQALYWYGTGEQPKAQDQNPYGLG